MEFVKVFGLATKKVVKILLVEFFAQIEYLEMCRSDYELAQSFIEFWEMNPQFSRYLDQKLLDSFFVAMHPSKVHDDYLLEPFAKEVRNFILFWLNVREVLGWCQYQKHQDLLDEITVNKVREQIGNIIDDSLSIAYYQSNPVDFLSFLESLPVLEYQKRYFETENSIFEIRKYKKPPSQRTILRVGG